MDIKDMKKPHFVYMMRGVGTTFFKIGMSQDYTRRKRQYSLPFDLEVIKWFQASDYWEALDLEKRIQQLYRNHRCRGEWFTRLSPEFFISDLEWLSLKEYTRAEAEYLGRGEKYSPPGKRPKFKKVVVRRDTNREDRAVLQTLKEEGLEAAMKLRKELHG